MILNKSRTQNLLQEIYEINDLNSIREKFKDIKANINSFKSDKYGLLNISSNGDTIEIKRDYFENEINQILETKSLDRTKYYIKRLLKSITEVKTSKINDINLNRWKEYDDIFTDSLWILEKRDKTGAHNAGYWGNFIPQIPNQLLRRFTKKNDWVIDPFVGSGTTLLECNRLGRNGLGIELKKEVVNTAKQNLSLEDGLFKNESKVKVIQGDSSKIDFSKLIKDMKIPKVQFAILHPPYWDIIKFSKLKEDLSNAPSVEIFLSQLGEVIDNIEPILERKRFLALVIGDKYSKGQLIPLGFYAMQEVLKRRFLLKSTIVKNFAETKGKQNKQELWRYRALVGGFYIFKHEYIFLFQKV